MEPVFTEWQIEQLERVKVLLAYHKLPKISWHTAVNNHASTRPKIHGGKLCESVRKCKTYNHVQTPGSASVVQCTLTLPNSFQAGDGIVLVARGTGTDEQNASEDACHTAFAILLILNMSQVVLREAHWNIEVPALVNAVNTLLHAEGQALPVHQRTARQNGLEGDAMGFAARDVAVADLLRMCLRTHGGEVDPARISRDLLRPEMVNQGLDMATQPRMFQRLDALLHPRQLRPWIEQHPDFQWKPHGAKGMRVTWAEPAPAALLDGPAHARAPASGSAGSANIEEMPPPPSRPPPGAEPAALLDGRAHACAPASGSAGSANIEEMPPPPSRPASNTDAPASGSAVQSFYEKKRRQSSNGDAPASGSASVTQWPMRSGIFLLESPVIQEQNLSSASDSRWKKQSSSSEAYAGRSWGGNTWSRSAWDYKK